MPVPGCSVADAPGYNHCVRNRHQILQLRPVLFETKTPLALACFAYLRLVFDMQSCAVFYMRIIFIYM